MDPVFLMRASGYVLVAGSLAELVELLVCANAVGHEIELVHAYFPCAGTSTVSELRGIARLLPGAR
jgi:hypothetical protein